MAIYAWMGLPVQIHMTDENAAAYNRVGDILASTPVPTNPVDIQFVADPADIEVWNKVSDVINGMIELNGGTLPYDVDDATTDRNHMVKVVS